MPIEKGYNATSEYVQLPNDCFLLFKIPNCFRLRLPKIHL